jgi:hypothetical protein
MRMPRGHAEGRCLLVAVGILLWSGTVGAQDQGKAAPQAPKTPRASAPEDLTGYWVAVITEDWRYRMVTPPKGDYASVPLNAEAQKAADQWDLAKDIAAGEQCRPFGAAGIMRMPLRLHVSWQDDTTLKLEIDNGNQTRLFRFDKSVQPPAQASWQGFSAAQWETSAEGLGEAPRRPPPPDAFARPGEPAPETRVPLSGSLKVITTKMRPGYLRRNGVPYSANTRMTEFFDRTTGPNDDTWLILTSVIEDPQYLQQPFILTTHYKREPDGSKFSPRPCEETAPVASTK